MAPKISVALATYNGERFLEEQLDSLAAQTCPPCELVVGDDGSSDRTIDILDRFAKRVSFPVRIKINAANLGYGENFLSTASRCSGEWIAFCDQDDVWVPKKVEVLRNAIAANARADLVISGTIFSDTVLQPLAYDPPLWGTAVPAFFHSPNLKIFQGHRMAFRRSILNGLPWSERPLEHSGRKLAQDRYICMIGMLSRTRTILSDHLTLYRRHASADTFSERLTIGETVKRARKHAIEAYVNEQKIWCSLSEWLRALYLSGRYPDASWLKDAPARCTVIAHWYGLRGSIYDSGASQLRKSKALLALTTQGGVYQFGLQTIVKDVVELFSNAI